MMDRAAKRKGELFLLADEVAGDLAESAFGGEAELIVAAGLLADHQFAAAVARVEPFGVGHRAAAGAVEADTGAQLEKGTALRELHRVFVLDANPGGALAVFWRRERADGNFVSGGSGTDLAPVARGDGNESEQKGCQRDAEDDENSAPGGRRR